MVWYVHTEQYRIPLSLSLHMYVYLVMILSTAHTHTHVDDAKVGARPTENSQEIPDRTKDWRGYPWLATINKNITKSGSRWLDATPMANPLTHDHTADPQSTAPFGQAHHAVKPLSGPMEFAAWEWFENPSRTQDMTTQDMTTEPMAWCPRIMESVITITVHIKQFRVATIFVHGRRAHTHTCLYHSMFTHM